MAMPLVWLLTTLCCSTLQSPAPTAAQIERMREIYEPSAPHRDLETLVGEWEQEVKLASGKPEPAIARGRVTNRSILGGRFLVSEGAARAESGGLTIDSMLIFGFDGRSREYTVTVMDTFGTYSVSASGKGDAAARAIVMSGETPERGAMKRFDVVLTRVDADTYRTEIIFRFPDRPPSIAVETTYRRVRGGSPQW